MNKLLEGTCDQAAAKSDGDKTNPSHRILAGRILQVVVKCMCVDIIGQTAHMLIPIHAATHTAAKNC
jgi:hypothetical protein